MKYLFGPVPSRRLGRSLGIDLVPFKTCTYDCIYCQLGHTTHKTIERVEHVSWEPILEELKQLQCSEFDYITLGGSGEPTLCKGLGDLIQRIQAVTTTPVAVLTNGSMLWDVEVRRELRHADLVIPSIDAGDEERFSCINRPHDSISFSRMISGLVVFRREFSGQLWLEVMLLAGYTSTEKEVRAIADWVKRIAPDRVHLNTVTRPPAESFAEPVPEDQMRALASFFEPQGEVVAEYAGGISEPGFKATRSSILDMLLRRPCSLDDIQATLGLHINEANKYLDELRMQGLIQARRTRNGLFFNATWPAGSKRNDDASEARGKPLNK